MLSSQSDIGGNILYQRLYIANDNLSCRIQKELDRLERNKDRRHAREKQKSKQSQALQNAGGQSMAGSPSASGAANSRET
jgi:hypothetical protein